MRAPDTTDQVSVHLRCPASTALTDTYDSSDASIACRSNALSPTADGSRQKKRRVMKTGGEDGKRVLGVVLASLRLSRLRVCVCVCDLSTS